MASTQLMSERTDLFLYCRHQAHFTFLVMYMSNITGANISPHHEPFHARKAT